MTPVLAAEGGFQQFALGAAEYFWLLFSAGTALVAIGVGFLLMRGVLASDQGTATMRNIAGAIQDGAGAYLRRQFKTIAVIVVPLAAIVFLTSVRVLRPDGTEALSFVESGLYRTGAFVLGCLLSGLTGFIGMSLAVRGNIRTAAAALSGSLPAALRVAFRTGGVAGMFTVGLGLLGATIIILLFMNVSSAILVGFGLGGSLLALFLRVGGGIFTKAADIGADLVGKVEAGIPEDDPRNPATIADNVGDNVGDCAGMAADLFESYEVTLVASIILGVAAFASIGANPALGLVFPVVARAIGVLASIVGVYAVRATKRDRTALAPIRRGFLVAGGLTVVGTAAALAIRAVGRTAGTVVAEVRRQFREHPGIMDYTQTPDHGRVIDICTTASLRELATPALLAVLTPVIIGFGVNYFALGAFLAAVILTGQLVANFLSNAGGAWDNAKKYIEDGHEGGKGSDAHKAAVIGDTVGDPFKDTAGPALNPLIKVMNLVSLLILPAVIRLADNPVRLVIAGGAIVVLGLAIAFSKRRSGSVDTGAPMPAPELAPSGAPR